MKMERDSSGFAEQVLPPWTPVTAMTKGECVEVSVWGRTYRFANAPLPTGIFTAGEEVLSSPIRLIGRAEGAPIQWENSGAVLLRHDGAQATISGWQSSKALIANVTSRIEYDGMMRVDLVVMAHRGGGAKLEALCVEVPLKSEQTLLYTYWPLVTMGTSESQLPKNSGAIPDKGFTLPFRPFLWLGWEEGGLSWFAESDQGWFPARNDKAIDVRRHGNKTLLRFNLIDGELAAMAGPEGNEFLASICNVEDSPLPVLTFTFGFQATPVKPIPGDFHEWRVAHIGYGDRIPSYQIDHLPTSTGGQGTVLERMAKLGVRTIVFHQHWALIHNYWEANQTEEIRRTVCACHACGIKVMPYFGWQVSTLAPEWGEVAEQVLLKNTQGSIVDGYESTPPQRAYVVCYNSHWQDEFVRGIEYAMTTYGFDGVYLDGTTFPWGCANTAHGCGYRTEDGELRITYPIFAVRRLMKRLYALIHPRGGYINVHQSSCCCTPTLSFCHSYWDGEHVDIENNPLNLGTLAAFRAEFMGKNFGIPCEFLGNPESLVYTLLHDVRPRPYGYTESMERMAKIWDVMSKFGTGEAEWHPYWRNESYLKVEPETVSASVYLRRNVNCGKAQALLVVANLFSPQEVEARVMLHRRALGFSGDKLSVSDVLSGEMLSLKRDTLQFSLQRLQFKIVLVIGS